MARPRKDDSRDTRQGILDRALDLFAEHGFYGTSMRQIAGAVGVRESALYHYFPSKQAIFHELVKDLGPGRMIQLASVDVGAMVDALGAEGVLRQLLDVLITAWSTPQEMKLFRVMVSEGLRLDAEGVIHPPQVMRKIRSVAGGLFAQLVEKKLIRPVDPEAAALSLMGPLMMLRVMYLAMPSEQMDFKGLKAEVDRHVAFFWESVKPLPDARPRRRAS